MSVERVMFEGSPDGLFLFDREGLLIEVNPAGCRLLGAAREALVGHTRLAELVHDDVVRTEDGGARRVEVRSAQLDDGRTVLTLREPDTQDRLVRLEQVLAATPDVFFTLDRQQRHTGVYGAWLARDGLSPEAFLGKRARDLFGPEAALVHEGANARALSGEHIVYEWSAETPSMGVRHFQTAVSPLANAAGDIVGVIGIGRDITDTHRTREALRTAEARFRKAFDAAPVAMTLSRVRDGLYVDINRATCELFETDRESILGRTSVDLGVFPSVAARDELARELREHGHVHLTEMKVVSRRGRMFDVLVSCELIDLDGELHILAGVIDITARKRLEAELLHSQKLEAIGQLAGGVAHDFNNLLAALSLQLGLMQSPDPLPHEEVQESVLEMLATVERAASLTRQLLMFGRRDTLHKKRHDYARSLAETEKLLRRVLGEHVELIVEKSPTPVWVDGDETMLQQVVLNLCINARDAMPGGGRLHVSLQRTDVAACLKVADEGRGIDPAVVERIFEPFYTTKDVGEGSGLGLSAVHGIVGQHGGSVRVESKPDRGTVFTVCIPLAKELDDDAGGRAENVAPKGCGRVLLVEDEPMVRRMASRTVRDLGYEVVEACDARDASTIWEREHGRFDILFTDMVMPGKETGIELSRRLRKEKPELRVVIASGYSVDLSPGGATDGNFTFLAKPYTRPILAAALRAVAS